MNVSVGVRSCSIVPYGGTYEQAIWIGGFEDNTTTALSELENLWAISRLISREALGSLGEET